MTDEPASLNSAAAYAILSNQIAVLSETIAEVRSLVKALDDHQRRSEIDAAGIKAVNAQQIKAAHRRLDEHERSILAVGKRVSAIEAIMPLIQDILDLRKKLIVLVFLSGFLGTSLGAMVVALLFNFLFREFANGNL